VNRDRRPPSHLLRTSRSPRTSLAPVTYPLPPPQVLEPHSHLLGQKMRAATRPDELIAHHSAFLDACLKECMLRDAVLLKLLAKLLTICVIFADHTRVVMADVARELDATSLAQHGAARRQQLAVLSAQVARAVADCRYTTYVRKLGAKFDDELRALLAELRKHGNEWNLANLYTRLDYNLYWSTSAGGAGRQ
jgi:gamma-tubulin complex component 2